MKKKQALLVVNGEPQGSIEEYRAIIGQDDITIIAVDGGLLLVESLGLFPDLLLGDFDSIPREKLEYYQAKGVEIIRYPVEKDETDAELAINYCLSKGYRELLLIGSMGGRLDQQLANIFLLEYAYRQGLNLVIKEPGLELGIIKNEKIFNNCKDKYFSLIPISEEVRGVTLEGFQYNLQDAVLYRYMTRGISNKFVDNSARASVEKGIALYLLQERI
ncbi:MAG: thiamine diphosphokinase [Halanaerobiales bacterium]